MKSGIESLATLEYIIKTKYSVIFKLEDGVVYGNDGVMEYLTRNKKVSGKAARPGGEPTISMTISIHNVDQETCSHFLWDLAQKGIRDKFKFDFDSALNSGSQTVIMADELEAHQSLVSHAFGYLLNEDPKEQTQQIGRHLVFWLPGYLGRLRELVFEGNEQSNIALTPSEQSEINQNLYRLFKNDQVIMHHKSSFESTYWTVQEMEGIQSWLMDSAVYGKLDRAWQREVRQADSPITGILKELVKVVVRGFLRERSWNVNLAYDWIEEFIELVSSPLPG